MASVRWSLTASRHLRDVVEFLSGHSPEAASAFVDEIAAAVGRLEAHPRLGRQIPEYADPALREVLVSGYRLMYELEDENVGLLAVLHGRRNVLRALGRHPRS